MYENNVVSTPLIFPKVYPLNWNEWWKIWEKNSKILWRLGNNHNNFFKPGPSFLKGFDIYKDDSIDYPTGYKSEYIDCQHLFPSLFDNISLLPIHVRLIKVVSSFKSIKPHSDWAWPEFSIRSLIYDNNKCPNFYYVIKNKKKYLNLPDETNTWGYWDNKGTHGSDYYVNHQKILFMYYGPTKTDFDIDVSVKKFQEYVIFDDV
jgi:hypothetical protein